MEAASLPGYSAVQRDEEALLGMHNQLAARLALASSESISKP